MPEFSLILTKKATITFDGCFFEKQLCEKYRISEKQLADSLFIISGLRYIIENTLASCRKIPYRVHRVVV